jgi:hypothetical protein
MEPIVSYSDFQLEDTNQEAPVKFKSINLKPQTSN